MSVTVRLPPVLRVDAGGARTVELDAPGDLRGAQAYGIDVPGSDAKRRGHGAL